MFLTKSLLESFIDKQVRIGDDKEKRVWQIQLQSVDIEGSDAGPIKLKIHANLSAVGNHWPADILMMFKFSNRQSWEFLITDQSCSVRWVDDNLQIVSAVPEAIILFLSSESPLNILWASVVK